MKYEVRRRKWPKWFPPLKRPWEITKEVGEKKLPVGFYETEQAAQDALAEVVKAMRRTGL